MLDGDNCGFHRELYIRIHGDWGKWCISKKIKEEEEQATLLESADGAASQLAGDFDSKIDSLKLCAEMMEEYWSDKKNLSI